MAKIIKNTTAGLISIQDTGVSIPASPGSYTIQEQEYLLWAASSNTATLVTAGNLVVNDGVSDLSIADGLYFLKYPDTSFAVRFLSESERANNFSSKNVQTAIEEARNTRISKLLNFSFTSSGVTSNKWAQISHPSTSSDQTPYTIPWDGKIIGLSFSNTNDNTNTDIKFYKNNTLVYTWAISNKRTAWMVLNAGIFSATQGDRLSVFFANAGTSPKDIVCYVVLSIETLTDGSGGTSSGV